jgi:hypothetical protein
MSHPCLAAIFPAIVCLSLATPATAKPPDPANCEVPSAQGGGENCRSLVTSPPRPSAPRR